MKSENILGIIGIVIVGVLLGYYTEVYQRNAPVPRSTAAISNGSQTASSTSFTLSPETVAKHSTAGDCWMIIENKVYNVTQYLALHPGGRSIMIPFCGADATQAFLTKAGQGTHSQNAVQQLGALLVGNLNASIITAPAVTSPLNTNSSSVQQATPPVPTVPTSVTLDAATVASHNNAQDCWLIIHGTVYAVTGYLNAHPGGRSIIIPFCGKDATRAFDTKAGAGSHSSAAVSELARLAIGAFGGTTTVQNVQRANTSAQQIPGGQGDQEEENEHE